MDENVDTVKYNSILVEPMYVDKREKYRTNTITTTFDNLSVKKNKKVLVLNNSQSSRRKEGSLMCTLNCEMSKKRLPHLIKTPYINQNDTVGVRSEIEES